MPIFLTRTKLILIGILLVSGIIVSSGSTTLPLDAHEVFVVQTTQEMHDRHDWIMPWFNNEPRLNKPPLNYWITGAVAWITNSPEHIQAWHGRFISMIAAIGILFLTFLLGNKLYNTQISIIATALLASSTGFLTYSHSARPDMLYAFLCAGGYTAFVLAWKSVNTTKCIWFAYVMWVAYALATLSKGPHMPAIYLLSSLLFCWSIKTPWKELLKIIRPFAGIILYLCITVPWWYAVNQRLGGEGLHGTQLGGSLFTVDFKNFFKFYYFYRPLAYLLPWIIFIPYTISYFIQKNEYAHNNRLLAFYIIIPAVILNFGNQERWFYLLPSIIPIAMLLAAGVNYVIEQPGSNQASRWFALIVPGLILAPVVIFFFLIFAEESLVTVNSIIFAVCILLALSTMFVVLMRKRLSLVDRLLVSCLVFGITFSVLGFTNKGWSKERFEYYRLATIAHNNVDDTTLITTVAVNPDVYVYYVQLNIKTADSMHDALKKFNESSCEKVLLIIRTRNIKFIPDNIKYNVMYTTDENQDKSLSLVMIKKAH